MARLEFEGLQAAVRTILKNPGAHRWTVQGFGFLRTYFGSKEWRLNIWDSALAIPNVSVIHDHPWSFESIILAGEFQNIRYDNDPFAGGYYCCQTLKTGEGGELIGSPCTVRLLARSPECYTAGDTYAQDANEIHETRYGDGAVTLNKRIGDTQHARIFWPDGEEWVDAIPRAASSDEVIQTIKKAIERL